MQRKLIPFSKVVFLTFYTIVYIKLLIDVLAVKPLLPSIPLHILFLVCFLFISLNNYKNHNTTFFLVFISASLLVSISLIKYILL